MAASFIGGGSWSTWRKCTILQRRNKGEGIALIVVIHLTVTIVSLIILSE
jgi:hypothetical protein